MPFVCQCTHKERGNHGDDVRRMRISYMIYAIAVWRALAGLYAILSGAVVCSLYDVNVLLRFL